MAKQKSNKNYEINLKTFAIITTSLLLVLFVLNRLSSFENALSSLKNTSLLMVIIGISLTGLTFIATSFSYSFLSLKKLMFRRLLLIEVANGFVSKLIPAGVGGLALHARFLYKNSHSLTQAGSIAALNNIIGFLSFITVLITINATSNYRIVNNTFPNNSFPAFWWYVVLSGLLLTLLAVFSFPKSRKNIRKQIKSVIKTLKYFEQKPLKIIGSYISALVVTISYVGILYVCAVALGANLSVLQVFVVFSVGIISASVTPTPGGVGGAEAGLTAALTASGLEASIALSIALLYRLITYWLPLVPGFVAFQYAIKRSYI